ncbi:SDR family oxidoreductase [Paenibacillus alvei]|uniref:SDR family oxidoreductase n=1 Tax=Paenibacillus alvei TaxID=44250 RepID=UPI0018CDD182|nr:SDR family oxidoreductase [Paenibacillus alvei]MBG9735209.1 short-chain dehydrogenase [Paenibacillus alvei]MBG9743667.1 short-chain dehydrogenase [Paenibacillus alvei]MCY9580081.1 SDR family oxidoreductase [Paenibacillus alvei]MCY9584256.1 SDR family oxidoreductase [Paenibacillus alvei]
MTSPHYSEPILKQGKQAVAVVTGSSSGFGLHTCIELARSGYLVVATMRNPQQSSRLLQEAETQGVKDRIDVQALDVTDTHSIASAAQYIQSAYGGVHVLVNNAGFAIGGFIEEISMDEWHAQLNTNFFGTVEVTRALLPYMRQQGSGTIINVSSISGRCAFPGYAPYAASKFAVEGFTESLRMEMLPYGIYAVLVEPGSYRTDIWSKGFNSISSSENSPYQSYLKHILQYSEKNAEKAPPPHEVARLIASIANDPKPRLRYTPGWSRAGMGLLRAMPWKWYERLIIWMLHR